MLDPIKFLKRPEYFWRPSQVLRRFRRVWRPRRELEVVALPWGSEVQVCTGENIGSDIYHYGIFDKIVPEAIARLTDSGEWAIEVGANIGQNCSLMASKVGPSGRVFAFEPHPEIFAELSANAARWDRAKMGQLTLEKVALGNARQEAWLKNGAEFDHNRGSASLETGQAAMGGRFKVQVCPLDDYLKDVPKIGVCKIDVEGNELAVLEGAKATLSRKAIRDIVYEDFGPQPSPVALLLRQSGFEVFSLLSKWLGPCLARLGDGAPSKGAFSYNYLATLDTARACARFRPAGWTCLRAT